MLKRLSSPTRRKQGAENQRDAGSSFAGIDAPSLSAERTDATSKDAKQTVEDSPDAGATTPAAAQPGGSRLQRSTNRRSVLEPSPSSPSATNAKTTPKTADSKAKKKASLFGKIKSPKHGSQPVESQTDKIENVNAAAKSGDESESQDSKKTSTESPAKPKERGRSLMGKDRDADAKEKASTTTKTRKKKDAKEGDPAHTIKEDEEEDGDQQNRSIALSPLRRKPKQEPAAEGATSEKPGRQKQRQQLRARPSQQSEVHIIGDIVGGANFGRGGFVCKWSVEYGASWQHIAGDQLGQTQIDYPSDASGDIVWCHPIDLHLVTSSFQGWPKLLFQVWQISDGGVSVSSGNVVGYGFLALPFKSGQYDLRSQLWRPMGSGKEELEAQLLGHTPELVTDDVVFTTAWSERCRLRTIATGQVHVSLGILLRNFHENVDAQAAA